MTRPPRPHENIPSAICIPVNPFKTWGEVIGVREQAHLAGKPEDLEHITAGGGRDDLPAVGPLRPS